MYVLEGAWVCARIYLGEDETCGGHPAWRVLLEKLEREGFAGGTAYRAEAGFGAHNAVNAQYIGAPITVEIIERREAMDELLRVVNEVTPFAFVAFSAAEVYRVRGDQVAQEAPAH